MNFSTKARTLELLANRVKQARILPQIRFSLNDWNLNRQGVIDRIEEPAWKNQTCIVRSSALNEDNATKSQAGHYLSVAGVYGRQEMIQAIERVAASFDPPNDQDEIFIQPMLENIRLCGVAFTMDPSNLGHYFVLNYDQTSGSTSSVTAGNSNELNTFYHSKTAKEDPKGDHGRIIGLLWELMDLFKNEALDVEFAITWSGELHLFQVRPLVISMPLPFCSDEHAQALEQIYEKVVQLNRPHPYLCGSRTVLGVMPDWNPAEIIGIRPHPLALSLYKELVTDSIWAYQRSRYGYRNLRSFPLLISLGGMPYIDVRTSFNSFVPADIDNDLAHRLVDYYIHQLVKNPTFHDKVEFQIISSCYTLNLDKRLQAMREYGFSNGDCDTLAQSLLGLTNRIIHGSNGLWRGDLERIDELKERQQILGQANMDSVSNIYWLIEDCKRYGTLPFAGLARAGFIAVQMLQSLVETHILSQEDYNQFMQSLQTVSSQMTIDLSTLNRNDFIRKYGHLRPGTYEILSPRYDDNFDQYFNWSQIDRNSSRTTPFRISLVQMKKIDESLRRHRLDHDVVSLLDFIKSAIEGREYAKFVFSRSISDVLFHFGNLMIQEGFSLEDASFADIGMIKKWYDCCDFTRQDIQQTIEKRRAAYKVTRHINLPPLIFSPDDVHSFELPQNEPNYITQKSVVGEVAQNGMPADLFKGKILMIEKADPGFDWIFSRGIGGFITMYGGCNSHMAIRANELDIPAVIGVGETLYKHLQNKRMLQLDCDNRKIHVFQ